MPMSGYYKDHKPLVQGSEHLGPKLRPVCGAVESSNGDRMDREVGALCLSTEEMCCALEIYNRRADTTINPVVFSVDVIGM